MEKFTPLAKILHCRRQRRQWQISPLSLCIFFSSLYHFFSFCIMIIMWSTPFQDDDGLLHNAASPPNGDVDEHQDAFNGHVHHHHQHQDASNRHVHQLEQHQDDPSRTQLPTASRSLQTTNPVKTILGDPRKKNPDKSNLGCPRKKTGPILGNPSPPQPAATFFCCKSTIKTKPTAAVVRWGNLIKKQNRERLSKNNWTQKPGQKRGWKEKFGRNSPFQTSISDWASFEDF